MTPQEKAVERRKRQGRNRLVAWYGSLMDCGDVGCGLCRVCNHYAFQEWVGSVSSGVPHSVSYDRDVVAHLKSKGLPA